MVKVRVSNIEWDTSFASACVSSHARRCSLNGSVSTPIVASSSSVSV